MSVPDDLLVEIKNTLGATINPSLTNASAASNLFEAYTLSLVIEAAKTELSQKTFIREEQKC